MYSKVYMSQYYSLFKPTTIMEVLELPYFMNSDQWIGINRWLQTACSSMYLYEFSEVSACLPYIQQTCRFYTRILVNCQLSKFSEGFMWRSDRYDRFFTRLLIKINIFFKSKNQHSEVCIVYSNKKPNTKLQLQSGQRSCMLQSRV